MTILITGAGLLGCHTAKMLHDRKEKVMLYSDHPDRKAIRQVCDRIPIVQGDILDMKLLRSTLKEYAVTDIIHTAVVRQKAAEQNPKKALHVNVQGTKNIIAAAVKGKLRIVYPSSAGVYGLKVITQKPIPETFQLNPGTTYARTKVQSETLLVKYPNSVILRFPSLFGPFAGDTSTGNTLIRKMIIAALQHRQVVLDNPFPPSEHLYVKDAAHAMLLVLHAHLAKYMIFNIGTGRLVSYAQILARVKKQIPSARIKMQRARGTVDFRNRPMDCRRAQRELGFKPQFSLEEALQEYIKTIKQWEKEE